MIILLLLTGGLALFGVYVFKRYVEQRIAAAELAAHREYQYLVNGLDKDSNTLKVEIIGKYEAAISKLEDSVR